jgi:hypothetical protein
MALDTYSNLKAALASWNFDRTDLPDSDCVTLAETWLQRELLIRTGEIETDLTGVASSRYITLPTGFLAPVALFVDISGLGRTELAFVPAGMETTEAESRPDFWTVAGTNIAFERPCDQAYTFPFRFVQAFTPLSDSAPTNWLLTNQPDLYLAAANLEAALWLQDDDQAVRWKLRRDEALAGVNFQASRSKSLATLRVDPALQPSAMSGARFDINRGY